MLEFDVVQAVSFAPYVWGVRWQELYPGGKVITDSDAARLWQDRLGMEFHEVQIVANAHSISLVCGGLEVSEVAAGYSPFIVGSA